MDFLVEFFIECEYVSFIECQHISFDAFFSSFAFFAFENHKNSQKVFMKNLNTVILDKLLPNFSPKIVNLGKGSSYPMCCL